MASLRKRKDLDGKYTLDYTDVDNRRYRIDTGTDDKDEADEWMRLFRKRFSQAKRGEIERVGRLSIDMLHKRAEATRRRKRLSEFLDEYQRRQDYEFNHSENTKIGTRNAFKSVISKIGDAYLEDLVEDDVRRWRESLDREGRSRATQAIYHNSVNAALNRAVKSGYLLHNPFLLVSVPTPNQIKRQDNDMSADEVSKLLEEVRKAGNRTFENYVLGVLYTGGRRNEILGLKSEDIDLEQMAMKVKITKRKDHPVIVDIPIIPPLAKVFQRMDIKPGEYVFKSETDSSRPLRPNSVTQAFRRYRNKAELPEKYTLHSLRHTYSSYLSSKGAPAQAIAALLSHTSPRMVMDVYDHSNALDMRKFAELMDIGIEDIE